MPQTWRQVSDPYLRYFQNPYDREPPKQNSGNQISFITSPKKPLRWFTLGSLRFAVGEIRRFSGFLKILECRHFSTPNMIGRRLNRTTEAIPRCPWKAKSAFASRPIRINIMKATRRVRTRHDTVHFFHSFPSCGAPVVQSYRSPNFVSRGDKRALFKRALCSLPDFWP